MDKKTFNKKQSDYLLSLVVRSINYGLEHDRVMPFAIHQIPDWLLEKKAVFVTLTINGELRGCIGTLEARESHGLAVVSSAYNAAFKDPRFSPLEAEERADLDIHLSILSQPEVIAFSTQEHLLEQIIPFKDGLILTYQHHRGTFLPSVWSSLPKKQKFLQQLLLKAGLASDFWDDRIVLEKYQTFSIEGPFTHT